MFEGQVRVNPLTADPDYTRFFHFISAIKIKIDTNQENLKIVDLHLLKSAYFSLLKVNFK